MSGDFSSEAALCEAFTKDARAAGWTVYPEQHGWDLLLVGRGVQVGVQAKLVGNVHMLLQALPDRANHASTWQRQKVALRREQGPHYRAVLVGSWAGRTDRAQHASAAQLYALARHLRVLVLEPPDPAHGERGWLRQGWDWNLSWFRHWNRLNVRHYRWRPANPVWLPPFVPEHPAGVPNPKTAGPWQIAAVRLEARVRQRGYATHADAVAITIEVHGRWNPTTLLHQVCECTGVPAGDGQRGLRWKLNIHGAPPSVKWPAVAKGLGLEFPPMESTQEA